MTAPDLLGVFVRAFGLTVLFFGVPVALENQFAGGLYALAGVLVIATANAIVRLCYW